jgi:PleD family two-component response regulator
MRVEQAKKGRLAKAPGQGEEARREAPHVDACPAAVNEGDLLLAVVDDLFVRSRIDAGASVAGVEVRYIANVDDVRAAAAERPIRAVLVGMAATRRPWPEIVRQLRADDTTRELYVLAFGPHKNLDLRSRALDVGVDRVVANSAFTRLLPTLLTTPTAAIPDEEE